MAKYPYPTSMRKPLEHGYHYRDVTREYYHFPTEKQTKLLNDLQETCAKVGLDLTDFEIRTKTKRDAAGSIRALYTILNKNGYDSFGNPLNKEATNETL